MSRLRNHDCMFCKIAEHTAKATIVFENDAIIAFHDIHPEAPVHVLVVPKWHIEKLTDIQPSSQDLEPIMSGVLETVRALGVGSNCTLLTRNGKESGQVIPHLHFHILSKKKGSQISN